MKEDGNSPNNSSSPRDISICNECGSNPWKYRCPGCSIRTCSLPCVNSHKRRSGCTGKRNRAEFVPLSQFDDNLLLSDYTFLEETKRFAESARRKIGNFRDRFKLPDELRKLRYAVRRRRVCLLFFPRGMSKRESNQSMYDARTNSIFWTIELRFHGTDVVMIHHRVDEHVSLLSVLGKHLEPAPWNHKLRPFCDVPPDDLKLFIRKNPKGKKSTFRKLDINSPLSCQLRNILILEYPLIFVYLPSHEHDFEVETIGKPLARKAVSVTSDDFQSHKGTLFREVEFEEGDMASYTRVTDQMDCEKPEATSVDVPSDATAFSDTKFAEAPSKEDIDVDFTNEHMQKVTNGDCGHLDGEEQMVFAPSSPQISEDGFCFEQELTDVYSDLIGEINPDDFLCLDAGYNDADYLGDASWCFMEEGKENVSKEGNHYNMNLHVVEEGRDDAILPVCQPCGEVELEEGEIPCL
ncbi:hypothetical protein HPP92_005443 [Vanilla planifolia]|uniref:Box C/D snoRNA protein 1 n=1 Tax=Vanilla planifolia TaxID=51239 RepID=A0A835RMQ5_VANPL|nr:hypothetical protein HPP92_005443 [Vanilla planifolia]